MTAKRGICGMNCHRCTTFLATRNDDAVLRKKIALLFMEELGIHVDPEEVRCHGCWADADKRFRLSRNCTFRKTNFYRQIVVRPRGHRRWRT